MANVDTPFGLRPKRKLNGPYIATLMEFSTDSGDTVLLGIGDPVELIGEGDVINGRTYSRVARAETGDKIAGVVVAVKPVTSASTIYREASTQRIVQCEVGTDVVFEIQEVSGGTALTAAAIGLNCDFVVADASTTTGRSGVELDNSTEATTNTLDLKILGLINREDNAVGEHAKWEVMINRSQWANQVAGV